MEPLLFLAHRLPFPPNKGDKVRSYHFLSHLAERYRVFLGTFIDDPADRQHVAALEKLCAEVQIETLVPWSKRALSAACLVTGEPLTLPYFRSRGLQEWVHDIVRRERIKRAFCYSSPMAQYALDIPDLSCIADFVDMDSAKWGDYADRRSWPVSALYRRESERLLAYEREVAARADAVVFVTDEEARLFRDEAPECSARVATIRNGVDAGHFSPASVFASPFPPAESPIVFTGAMDYWPNIDAVTWFARKVLPEIRSRGASVRFYIVGMNPEASVRALASDDVFVTGRVDDVRPYLQHARVVVAPMRVARGIQNKVLEAMAMARAVVVTPASAAALSARPGDELEVAGEPREFAEKVVALLAPERARRMGGLARARVVGDYGWAASFARLDALLNGSTAQRSDAATINPPLAMPAS